MPNSHCGCAEFGRHRRQARASRVARHRSDTGSTSPSGRTRTRSRCRRATIRAGRSTPRCRRRSPPARRPACRPRRAPPDRAWCRSTACWDDPRRATAACCRRATGAARRRNRARRRARGPARAAPARSTATIVLTASPGAGVVLAHADPARAPAIDHAVGKAPVARPRRRGRERLRRAAFGLAVEPPVGEVARNRACRHRPARRRRHIRAPACAR